MMGYNFAKNVDFRSSVFKNAFLWILYVSIKKYILKMTCISMRNFHDF